MPSRRPERVSGLLLKEVADILLHEVKDPRVSGVILTDASISPDLKVARIFFRTLRVEEQTVALAGLHRATGYIRRQVAGRLRLRYTPSLRFIYDTTLDQASRLEHLIQQATQEEEEKRSCQD